MENEEIGQAPDWADAFTYCMMQKARDELKAYKPNFKEQYLASFDAGAGDFSVELIKSRSEAKVRYPQIDLKRIGAVYDLLREKRIDPKYVSLVIPAHDFGVLYDVNNVENCHSSMRIYGMEILLGEDDVSIWYSGPTVVSANREALEAEILRCLGRDCVRELPQSASGNGVSPRAKTVGEIAVTPRPASGDHRDADSLAHLSDEAKVIAAKEAIAAYARKKQLPSAAHLAVFRELDSKRAGNKGRGLTVKDCLKAKALLDADDIDRYHHSLSAEPLSRAIDQIWVRENGGAYADLISSRSERLAEMVCRSEAAADG